MKIKRVIVGPLETNCYLVHDKSQTVIIDPGAQPEKIFSLLSSPVSFIIATHAHPDHIGAVWAIKNEFPEAKFLIHKADLPLLNKATLADSPPQPDGFLKEDEFSILNSQFSIMWTPGHSPGSICLQVGNLLLTGDTLFANGIGRTDYPYSNKADLVNSLKKLSFLPRNLTIYPGHDQSSTLGQALEQLPRLLEGF